MGVLRRGSSFGEAQEGGCIVHCCIVQEDEEEEGGDEFLYDDFLSS